MKQPTLEEVKEYFKNAKEVKCLSDGNVYDISKKLKEEINECARSFWCMTKKSRKHGGSIELFNQYKYAEILTYKEKTFSITESQINKLEKDIKNGYCNDAIYYLKKLFPEAFESEIKQLPKDFTGWAKANSNGNEKWLMFFEKGKQKFGFDSHGIWDDGKYFDAGIREDNYEATKQEVFEALKNEAVKRGFVGDKYVDITSLGFKNNDLITGGNLSWRDGYLNFGDKGTAIFKNGIWGKVIESITLSEAEQQLGKKIIV